MKFLLGKCNGASILFVAAATAMTYTEAAAPAPAPAAPSEAVSRVVTLLGELKSRITQDGALEQTDFDKYACWCEETTEKKTASITTARDQLSATGNKILQLKGSVATIISEVKQLIEDINKNEEAQKSATAVRQKESETFEAERQELQQATTALEQAIGVLRTATSASLLGRKTSVTAPAAKGGAAAAAAIALEAARAAAVRLPSAGARRVAEHRLAAMAEASRTSRYAPQSATIQGILKDMYSSFTTTLETRTTQEHSAQRAYEDLMASYQQALLTMQESLATKERAKTEAETMLADATQAYEDIEAQLKADVALFDTTKAACMSKASAWSDRKSLRSEELAGIEQALTILTSDDARELFGRAITPGIGTFLQIHAAKGAEQSQLANACDKLRTGAKRSRSLRLAALAASLSDADGLKRGVGHFDKVLEAIDTLVATLKEEEATDESRASKCIEQLHGIGMAKDELSWNIKKSEAKIDKFQQVVAASELDLDATIKELESVQQDMVDMKAKRTEANQLFLQAKADDLKAIELLEQAKSALLLYYQKNGIEMGTSFFQQAPNETVYEPTFAKNDKRKLESKGIVQILETIVEDLQTEIADGMKAEETAQLDFEASLAASEALETELKTRKANLDSTIASHNQQVTEENGVKEETQSDLDTELQTEKDLQPSCDWIRENLEERRKKRAIEFDALRTAKEYLADMKPASLVATGRRGRVHHSVLRGGVLSPRREQ